MCHSGTSLWQIYGTLNNHPKAVNLWCMGLSSPDQVLEVMGHVASCKNGRSLLTLRFAAQNLQSDADGCSTWFTTSLLVCALTFFKDAWNLDDSSTAIIWENKGPQVRISWLLVAASLISISWSHVDRLFSFFWIRLNVPNNIMILFMVAHTYKSKHDSRCQQGTTTVKNK